jgi:hypothetical protein
MGAGRTEPALARGGVARTETGAHAAWVKCTLAIFGRSGSSTQTALDADG